jgi:hypothetical protein
LTDFHSDSLGLAFFVLALLFFGIGVVQSGRAAWPVLRRWRPLTLAPIESDSSTNQEAEELRTRLAEVRQEREMLKRKNEELTQKLDERRRRRIDAWREFFDNFDYANENVRETATYLQIRPELKREIVERLEDPRHIQVELDNRSGVDRTVVVGQSPSSVKTLLLDEVTRLEREWGLI